MSAVSVSAGPGSRVKSRKERLQHIGMLWCLPYVIVFLGGTIIPMVYRSEEHTSELQSLV